MVQPRISPSGPVIPNPSENWGEFVFSNENGAGTSSAFSLWQLFQGKAQQFSTASSQAAYFKLPPRKRYNSVELFLKGSTSHGGLPATMPSLILYKVNLETGVSTSVETKSDDSADVTAYETQHSIKIDDLGLVLEDNEVLYALVTPELSTNSQVGLLLSGVKVG